MPKFKFFGLFLAFLLLAIPATGLAAGGRVTMQVSGTAAGGDAIDTLTLTGAGTLAASPVVESFDFGVPPGASANTVRDSILVNAVGLVNFTLIAGPTSNQIIIIANGNFSVSSVALDGSLVPFEPSFLTSQQSQQYSLLSAKAPGLTAYGAMALVVLLAGTAIWLFRKRNLKTA